MSSPSLTNGDVWLCRQRRPLSGGAVAYRNYLVLVLMPPMEWEVEGLVRSCLRHGDFDAYTQEVAYDNMVVLRSSRLRRSDWSTNLFNPSPRKLEYLSCIARM